MEEVVFFESGNVKVTNARFVVGNQTHAMNGVTSVASHVNKPSKAGPILGLVVGLFILAASEGSGRILGLGIAAACGYILYNQRDTHSVVLRSASGEFQALSDTDATFIGGVVAALNNALVHRG